MSLPPPDAQYGHTWKQVLKICRDRGIHWKTFAKAFGRNTCSIDDNGEINYYTCDIEKALYQLGCKDGKDHIWD